MANQNQLEIIKLGAKVWNGWRGKDYLGLEIDLSQADLRGANLAGADLRGADLRYTILGVANLRNSNLRYVDCRHADLRGADLCGADLRHANLRHANFARADLAEADLAGADLKHATLIEANIEQTILSGCQVYGLSVWNLRGTPKDQSNLVITKINEPIITIDDIQVAQFIYLLLNNKNVRNVIDTLTSKAVLILGRFTLERKIVLDAMANELRKNNLLPIIFDFDRPTDRDFTETIKTLAGLSLFIIVDITNPKSSPLELQATIPDYQIPLVTIIQQNEKPFSMFSDLQSKYDWVLPVIEYDTVDSLIVGFEGAILNRAWSKHQELQLKKANEVKVLSVKDFIKENGI